MAPPIRLTRARAVRDAGTGEKIASDAALRAAYPLTGHFRALHPDRAAPRAKRPWRAPLSAVRTLLKPKAASEPEPEPDGRGLMNQLPEELLAMIFGLVAGDAAALSAVSKKFRRIVIPPQREFSTMKKRLQTMRRNPPHPNDRLTASVSLLGRRAWPGEPGSGILGLEDQAQREELLGEFAEGPMRWCHPSGEPYDLYGFLMAAIVAIRTRRDAEAVLGMPPDAEGRAQAASSAWARTRGDASCCADSGPVSTTASCPTPRRRRRTTSTGTAT